MSSAEIYTQHAECLINGQWLYHWSVSAALIGVTELLPLQSFILLL